LGPLHKSDDSIPIHLKCKYVGCVCSELGWIYNLWLCKYIIAM